MTISWICGVSILLVLLLNVTWVMGFHEENGTDVGVGVSEPSRKAELYLSICQKEELDLVEVLEILECLVEGKEKECWNVRLFSVKDILFWTTLLFFGQLIFWAMVNFVRAPTLTAKLISFLIAVLLLSVMQLFLVHLENHPSPKSSNLINL